jgi:ubiquinone/menaquinone biosynthesis C-methylase UbiE
LFRLVSSSGYSFFFESLYLLYLNGFAIGEMPISLPPRTYGHSKMTGSEVKRSVGLLFSLYAATALNKEKLLISDDISPESIDASACDNQGWDEYWTNHEQGGRILYDIIAAFYRKMIIKQTLNHFIRKSFKPGHKVLHAGCGSGQVDTDISKYISITGLDISLSALKFYRKVNPQNAILHGSIFDIPLPSQSIDGIYNLGVMEHFTEDEIVSILREFRRVLKPNGRAVIFWPPEFGVSVVFLKGVKWYLQNILGKKNVKIHPDEITRVQSKKHVVGLLENAGFSVEGYYFGLRDFFTYSVIIVEKPLGVSDTKAASQADDNPLMPRNSP